MSRTVRSSWNLISGLLSTLLTLVIGIFSTPWILHWLGTERYGVYRVLQDWTGYLALFEFGLSGALLARFAMTSGQGNPVATRQLAASGIHLYLRLTFLMLSLGLVWVVSLPWIVTVETFSTTELRVAALVMLGALLLTPLSVFRYLAEARQQVYVVSLLLTLQSILTTTSLLIAAWAGFGLVGQGIATVLPQFLAPAYLLWDGLRRYPGILTEPALETTKRDIWSLNWPTFIYNLSGKVGVLADNVTVAAIISPVAVVPFFLTQRLASITLGQLQGIGNATWAGLVELYAQGQQEVFRHRTKELTRLVSGLGLCTLVPIAAYNLHFTKQWVGTDSFAGDWVSGISCLNVWLWSIFSLWGWPISGTGNVRLWTPYAACAVVLNLSLSIIATFTLGLVGPLLGTLITFLVIYSWSLPLTLRKLFGLTMREVWSEALTPLLWGIPYAIVVWAIARSHVPSGWFGLLAEMAASGLGGLVLWWALSLQPQMRAMWLARVRLSLNW